MNQISIPDLLRVLELPENSFPLRNEMQPAQAVEQLEVFKKLIKDQRRSLVKKYHPDLPENKDDTKMKMINNAADTFLKMKIQFRPVHQPVVVRYYHYHTFHKFGSASDTTSSTGS